jgi:hypothetical protein
MIIGEESKIKEITSSGDIEPNASDEKSIIPNIIGITKYYCKYQSIK